MKIWKTAIVALIIVLTATLISGSLAFAQGNNPNNDDGETDEWFGPWSGFGRGPMMGQGWNGTQNLDCPMYAGADTDGLMHDAIWEAIASTLGLSVDELEAEFAAGKSLPQIADERGVEWADLIAAVEQARREWIEQAVADDLISQEQADWMIEHMEGFGDHLIPGFGFGRHGGMMHRPGGWGGSGSWNRGGMRGGRMGGFSFNQGRTW
jgi:hypothetical protein